MRIKIETMIDKIGTIISASHNDKIKMIVFKDELDYKTIRILNESINKLLESFD